MGRCPDFPAGPLAFGQAMVPYPSATPFGDFTVVRLFRDRLRRPTFTVRPVWQAFIKTQALFQF